MLRNNLKLLGNSLKFIVKNIRGAYSSIIQALVFFVKSWWHFLLLAFLGIVFLYYPLGAYFIHNIDKNPNYELRPLHQGQSVVVDTLAFIINREVNDKMWTPNLPFFFPSYFLDDMPNFQLGMMEAVRVSAAAISKSFVPIQNADLSDAADLLEYPGTIWMFNPNDNLMPVPSATRQYRKARQLLLDFNMSLADDANSIFVPKATDLSLLLSNMVQNLDASVNQLQYQIREHSSDLWDEKADDVFFYNQGKLYAYLLILKAAGQDYKTVIVDRECYQKWTALLADLEAAVGISPRFVRNAGFSQSFAPNHLSYLAFYVLKVQKTAVELSSILNL